MADESQPKDLNIVITEIQSAIAAISEKLERTGPQWQCSPCAGPCVVTLCTLCHPPCTLCQPPCTLCHSGPQPFCQPCWGPQPQCQPCWGPQPLCQPCIQPQCQSGWGPPCTLCGPTAQCQPCANCQPCTNCQPCAQCQSGPVQCTPCVARCVVCATQCTQCVQCAQCTPSGT